MRVLGAVLAGGRSRRFGSDKALAVWRGRTLLEWSAAALAELAETVVICGREGGLPDRPAGGLGPLAGINAALHHARTDGFDAVLTMPCDAPIVDRALLQRLRRSDHAACLRQIPVIGLWPTGLADALDAHLFGADRSLHGWAEHVRAERIDAGEAIANVNTPADLAQLSASGSGTR